MPRLSLKRFSEEHPICCFCGGDRKTETKDEVPPRSMFVNKSWPEGYQFPACKGCNHGSREIDQALALFSRLSFADKRKDDETIEPFIRGLLNNRPDLMPEVANSSIQAKKILRELGIKKPEGTFAKDYPVALIPADVFNALNKFFKKLFCALYYKHTGRILQKHSPVAIVKSTNQIFEDDDPFAWLHTLPLHNVPTIMRSGKQLVDQFDYRWAYNDEEDLFGVSFQLRYSLFGLMAGPVNEKQIDGWPDGALLRTGESSV